MKNWLRPLVIGSVLSVTSLSGAEILFEEVSDAAGLTHSGPSFGASWADVNADGLPDLWVGNHSRYPYLGFNNGDGTFTDETSRIPVTSPDMHGTAWADFDNDGDLDALVSVGAFSGQGESGNLFFVNTGNTFVEQAALYGLDFPFGRGRTPLWLDWNLDGLLDIVLVNSNRPDNLAPTTLFTQQNNSFVQDANTVVVEQSATNMFAQLADLGISSEPPLLAMQRAPYPGNVYNLGVTPGVDVTSNLGFPSGTRKTQDIVYEDFNGDLVTDALVLSMEQKSTVTQIAVDSLRFWMESFDHEVTLVVPASIELELYLGPFYNMDPSRIYLGSSGTHPQSTGFTVSATNTDTWGIAPHDPETDNGVYIGFDVATMSWRISVSGGAYTWGTLVSTLPIVTFDTEGFEPTDSSVRDTFFQALAPGFADVTDAVGLGQVTPCISAVAADFDNDMDLDLYYACLQQTGNLPNRLYENQGDGTFLWVDIGGVSEGTSDGIADSVISADYDRDGFIDLFITNGGGADPFNNGPYQLLHNIGNSNHWIEIDLTGVVSNPHGIGSRVTVTAGGKAQRKLVDGGMHRFSQNHMRLHFGLASHTIIDSIDIQWPTGQVQSLQNITADQVLTIVEEIGPDTDADGILDNDDNCLLIVNPSQCDTNGDGFGNHCDADINDNNIVNFLDLALLKSAFLSDSSSSNWLEHADLNCNGVVNFVDLAILKNQFLGPPGPSGGGTQARHTN